MAHSAAEEPIEPVFGIQQDAQQKFKNALSMFEKCVFELERKCQRGNLNYHEIADAARRLHNRLHVMGNQYFAEPRRKEERDAFLATCLGVVEEYRGELEQHQEWKIILANLVKRLVNALMGLVCSNNFFPLTRTEIALKADQFKTALQADLCSSESNVIDDEEDEDEPETVIQPQG